MPAFTKTVGRLATAFALLTAPAVAAACPGETAANTQPGQTSAVQAPRKGNWTESPLVPLAVTAAIVGGVVAGVRWNTNRHLKRGDFPMG